MSSDTCLPKNNGHQTEKEEVNADWDGLSARLRTGRISWMFWAERHPIQN